MYVKEEIKKKLKVMLEPFKDEIKYPIQLVFNFGENKDGSHTMKFKLDKEAGINFCDG